MFPEVNRCMMEAHEQSHINDLPPDACKGKPDGFYQFPESGVQTECKAYKTELQCLGNVDCGGSPNVKSHPPHKPDRQDCEGWKKWRIQMINDTMRKLGCAPN
jgi:hypothetical protein